LVNETTVKEPLALPQHFGNCDHQDASTEKQKDKSKVVPCQGCTMDSHSKCYNKAIVGQTVWELATPGDFHIFSPNEKACWWSQNAKVIQAVSQWICLQRPDFCVEGMDSLITHCDKCLNLQGD
jgi:hypothetical protein